MCSAAASPLTEAPVVSPLLLLLARCAEAAPRPRREAVCSFGPAVNSHFDKPCSHCPPLLGRPLPFLCPPANPFVSLNRPAVQPRINKALCVCAACLPPSLCVLHVRVTPLLAALLPLLTLRCVFHGSPYSESSLWPGLIARPWTDTMCSPPLPPPLFPNPDVQATHSEDNYCLCACGVWRLGYAQPSMYVKPNSLHPRIRSAHMAPAN